MSILTTPPQDLIDIERGLGEWSIALFWRGSVAHDMHVPSTDPNSIDDLDLMSICVPPLSHYFGLDQYGSRGTKEIKAGKWDIVVYEARKFVGLLQNGNPNVLCALWMDDEYYIKRTPAFDLLRENRHLFTHRGVYGAFVGYAHDQLKRANRPATGLGYMGAKRKELVDKFSFDTKNCAHCIRLLRMGVEFLQTGKLQVVRPDREELLAIKRGEWPFDQIQAEADRLFAEAEKARDEFTGERTPRRDEISDLCVEVIQMAFRDRSRVEPDKDWERRTLGAWTARGNVTV